MTDKQIIIDGVDVSGCEFLIISTNKQMCRCIKSDLFGAIEFVENAKNGNCQNNPNCYYKQLKRSEAQCEAMFVSHTDLEKAYKAKEQECEELKKECAWVKESCSINEGINYDIWYNQKIELDQLKAELKSAKELREYTYNCCKQAGEELAKNSFEWDGKEKNLVVQAMELNERYDQLEAENEELKKQVDDLLHKPEIQDKILWKIDNEALLGSKDVYIYKLEKALAEIKDFVKNEMIPNGDTHIILRKISEVMSD